MMREDTKAHPFPFLIAFQTQEYMQGAIFWFICEDEAAGKFIRLPDGLDMLKANLLKAGMQEQEWESEWGYLEKYQKLFRHVVFQNVLIVIRGCWDWYVKKLAEFVIFAYGNNTDDALSQKDKKSLQRITHPGILEQVSILERVCNLDFRVPEKTKQYIEEMSLVRNLGLHNRWEVDKTYLEKTSKRNRWQVGDIRIFDILELKLWYGSLIDLISRTCKPMAIQYVLASPYSSEASS